MKRINWRCGSLGLQNNGLVEECKFEFYFDLPQPHCPICCTAMTYIPDGPSVSEILAAGLKREADKKKK
jgi:hypothetical protein|tara:strand:- start:3399 stop:3605 length:207 start_codon:yes stop_codon:yes gene_type:complete